MPRVAAHARDQGVDAATASPSNGHPGSPPTPITSIHGPLTSFDVAVRPVICVWCDVLALFTIAYLIFYSVLKASDRVP